ncbi:MAG: maleylacetate reductase [Alphaproteobacteria bacterium]
MDSFTYDVLPGRVVFGAGTLDRLGEEVARLGAAKALVLSTPRKGPAEEAAKRLGARTAGIFARAEMHVPVETARAARDEARRLGADACVAIGGGSTIGLGKAIALEFGLPIVAVPTTYAGSEMTPIWGLTEGGAKRTGRDPKVLPRTVIYDPELTRGLPAPVAGPSGINAIAHCVEALYAENANPITSLMAEEGIRALAAALPRVVAGKDDGEARSDALYGAWLAGTALGAVGMALHHKLCHTLGGSFGLPHAETHTIVLPHAAAYNRDAAPAAMARVARALGTPDAPRGLQDLARAVGAKLALKDIGMQEADLDRAAEIAAANPYYNPRPVERAAIRQLLDDAFFGRPPAAA